MADELTLDQTVTFLMQRMGWDRKRATHELKKAMLDGRLRPSGVNSETGEREKIPLAVIRDNVKLDH